MFSWNYARVGLGGGLRAAAAVVDGHRAAQYATCKVGRTSLHDMLFLALYATG